MDSKQFAWIYLIEQGRAGHSPSYYGGYDLCDKRLKDVCKVREDDYRSIERCKEFYLHEIKTYGVNWDKTQGPESDIRSLFQGTFAESKEKEYLTGTLILNNGTRQYWSSDSLEVSNVFEMMTKVPEYEAKGKEMCLVS